MADQFNAEEVLLMAEQIERNGQEFYRKAAEAVDDTDTSKLLSDLSEWEKGHEVLFASIRKGLSAEEMESTAIDPYCEEALFLQTMADEHVFNRQTLESITDAVKDRSPEELIDMAVAFEKDSLLFFLGLERMVAKSSGKDKVFKVIDEEIGHISYLERARRKLP